MSEPHDRFSFKLWSFAEISLNGRFAISAFVFLVSLYFLGLFAGWV